MPIWLQTLLSQATAPLRSVLAASSTTCPLDAHSSWGRAIIRDVAVASRSSKLLGRFARPSGNSIVISVYCEKE